MKRLIAILTIIILSNSVQAQNAKGRVFMDNNNNGRIDKDEKGVKDVVVTNGTDFVMTDVKGRYTIPAPANSIIFIIKPSGYQLPVNEYNLPQYYYLHYPEGVKEIKNSGIEPSGPLPEEINFALMPADEPDDFKVLIYGDTQVKNQTDINYLSRDIIAEVAAGNNYQFITVVGDLVHDRPDLYNPLNKVLSAVGIPVYTLPGNHDINYDALSDAWANTTYQSVYGPRTYAFNYADVHFIMLDNIIYSGDTVLKGYNDGFDEAVLSFIQQDLQYVPEDRLIVIMMHAPFIRNYSREPVENLDKLLSMLSDYPHTFSVSGHDHTVSQQIISNQYGWERSTSHHHFNTGAVCGDWWKGSFDELGLPATTMYDGTPNGYSILTVKGNEYIVDYKVARGPSSYQMNIYAEDIDVGDTVENHDIIVNFFTGGEGDNVLIRVDDSEWAKMVYCEMPDPFVVKEVELWEDTQFILNGIMPSNAVISRHIWKYPVPSGLNIGIHKIEVKAADFFGRNHQTFSFFRIY